MGKNFIAEKTEEEGLNILELATIKKLILTKANTSQRVMLGLLINNLLYERALWVKNGNE